MRSQEFITEYQKIHRGQLGGIDLLFRDSGEHGCRIEASVDGRILGSADFDRDENILVADQLEVDERYRGQGIAKIMYDYVKSLGYTIERSDNLTDAGRAFWRKNRGKRQVWEQELQEFSRTAPDIRKYLEKRGYKFLGAGVDQQAYLEPKTGHVLKVFGTQCDNRKGEPTLSDDQLMFKMYADFCKRYKDNPFLPRIYGYETFVYDTPLPQGAKDTSPPKYQKCLYLQIRTELLSAYSPDERTVLSDMSNAIQESVSWDQYYSDMEYVDEEQWYTPIWNRMTNSPEKIKMWGEFYKTMETLYKLGSKWGYHWDLHGDNIMRRSDGTPVIVDPWVIN